MRIGFIGLGIMGEPMARNLLAAGFALTVHGRRPETMAALIAAGAAGASSPAEVAARADIIITMVPDTADVEAVIFGSGGIVEGARPGSVVVDMSSISPTATRQMAQRLAGRGIAMLDAPVSGGDIGARNATLSIMVGGAPEVFARVLPVFEALGKNIVHLGEHGAGQITKLCNNLVVAINAAAVGEALLMASAAGVDPARVREALLGGFAASRVLEVHGQRMISGDFQPGFKARLHAKDAKNAQEAARDLGLSLPFTALTAGYLNSLVGQDLGDLDSSAQIKILEQMNGITVRR